MVLHPRKFVRDLAGVVVSQYLARAAVLARGVVTAAVFGPAGYGAWNALNLIIDYGSYASAGALQGLELKLPSAVEKQDWKRAAARIAGAWTMVLAGGALFAVVLLIYLSTGFRAIESSWGILAPLLMMVAALVQLVIQYHASVLRSFNDFATVSKGLAVQALLGAGVGLALIGRFGVWGLLGGWLFGSLVSLAILRRGSRPVTLVPGEPRMGLALVKAGFPIFGFFVASLILRSLDRIAFVRHAGPEALGYYSLGLMVAGLIVHVPESAAAVLYPRIAAAMHGARDERRTRSELERTQRSLAVLMPLLVGPGVLVSGPVVAWLLPAYVEGLGALRWLALGALLLSASALPAYWLLGAGKSRALLGLAAGSAVVTAILVFGTASRSPEPGAIAIATCLGYAVFATSLVLRASVELYPTPAERARFVVTSFAPAAAAAAVFVAVWPLRSSVGLATVAALFVVGYLPVLWWFGRGIGLKQLAQEWLAGRPSP